MDKPELRRQGFRLEGRVQGVGFRWWTIRTAESLGLRGTVRNLPDGSVEIDASGPRDEMERFSSLLRDGPPSARVESVRTFTPAGPVSEGFRAVR
jgi:acylphosphatase